MCSTEKRTMLVGKRCSSPRSTMRSIVRPDTRKSFATSAFV
jgi:hypothetical protein